MAGELPEVRGAFLEERVPAFLALLRHIEQHRRIARQFLQPRLPVDIRIESRPVSRYLPSSLNPISVRFEDGIELRGYRIDGAALPGGTLHISYAWYVDEKPQAIYAVFTHLIGTDGQIVTQVDGWPQEGRMLTNQWQEGEYVEDHYTLEIPSDVPSGPYVLYVGLYNAATDDRLPAYQDGERLAEDHVTINIGD